jgi:hypothetical protein
MPPPACKLGACLRRVFCQPILSLAPSIEVGHLNWSCVVFRFHNSIARRYFSSTDYRAKSCVRLFRPWASSFGPAI